MSTNPKKTVLFGAGKVAEVVLYYMVNESPRDVAGFVCDDVLDANGDGVIDEFDVPAIYDTNGVPGIQQDELDAYLADQETLGSCTFYDNEWVFNVAELVVQDQDITNDGVKLLKTRFYPVDTTEFIR